MIIKRVLKVNIGDLQRAELYINEMSSTFKRIFMHIAMPFSKWCNARLSVLHPGKLDHSLGLLLLVIAKMARAHNIDLLDTRLNPSKVRKEKPVYTYMRESHQCIYMLKVPGRNRNLGRWTRAGCLTIGHNSYALDHSFWGRLATWWISWYCGSRNS